MWADVRLQRSNTMMPVCSVGCSSRSIQYCFLFSINKSWTFISYRTTIVKNKETFWVDFKSTAITYDATCTEGVFTETASIEESDSSESAEASTDTYDTTSTEGAFTGNVSIEENDSNESTEASTDTYDATSTEGAFKRLQVLRKAAAKRQLKKLLPTVLLTVPWRFFLGSLSLLLWQHSPWPFFCSKT